MADNSLQPAVDYAAKLAEEVEGWFFTLDRLLFVELGLIQQKAGVGGDLCEIGVHMGKSLVLMSLLKGSSERLLGFDMFVGNSEATTKANLGKYGKTDNVTLFKGLTTDLSEAQLDSACKNPIRFLHIDAGHEYHEVLEQLLLFSPYVSDQAIIAMDDFQDREFPGVGAAVLDFCEMDRPRRFIPFLAGANKMYLCRDFMAASYQNGLINRSTMKDKCRLTRIKDYNILITNSKLPVASQTIAQQINATAWPAKATHSASLHEQATAFAQITFGHGVGSE